MGKGEKKKLKEDYNSGPDWTDEMQEAWDAWTWEEANKWDEYAKNESKASVAAMKNDKGTEKENKHEKDDSKKAKKKRKTEDGEKEETPEKKKKVEDGSAEPSPSERPPFPHRHKDQVAAVLDFLHKIETFNIPDPHTISAKNKDLIRCDIPNSAEARLTVYWKRPAVGVYMRSESRDIACFSFGAMADSHPFLLRLAASLKIGSLMVTCRTHLSLCM